MRKRENRLCSIAIILATALLFHCSTAWGQKPARVRVRLILASNQKGFSGSARELHDLSGDLRSLFNYRGYKLLSSSTTTVSPGKPASVGLPYGTRLEISSGGGGNGSSLSVRWLQGSRGVIVRTQVRLWGRTPVLIGGPTVKDGVLIVALSLR